MKCKVLSIKNIKMKASKARLKRLKNQIIFVKSKLTKKKTNKKFNKTSQMTKSKNRIVFVKVKRTNMKINRKFNKNLQITKLKKLKKSNNKYTKFKRIKFDLKKKYSKLTYKLILKYLRHQYKKKILLKKFLSNKTLKFSINTPLYFKRVIRPRYKQFIFESKKAVIPNHAIEQLKAMHKIRGRKNYSFRNKKKKLSKFKAILSPIITPNKEFIKVDKVAKYKTLNAVFNAKKLKNWAKYVAAKYIVQKNLYK
jgi:hypothetical protein